MKTFSDYTIYCTPEQTKNTLELGTPLEYTYGDCGIRHYINPTAEQMIGWLEEQKFFKQITVLNISLGNQQDKWIGFIYFTDDKYPISVGFYNSRKEATLAAIDAALEYLTNNKKR